MKILHKYKNGNYSVVIFEDGTKIRETNGDACPEFPESVDLKITDYCDAACPYCHENSSVNGKHADVGYIASLIDELPPGVEIAIGGGNPLSHFGLTEILNNFKENGLIANLTVNISHAAGVGGAKLRSIIERKLVYGVGISYSGRDCDLSKISGVYNENTVFHLICGIHDSDDIQRLVDFYGKPKILILGYKEVGRGKDHIDMRIKDNILNLRRNIYKHLDGSCVISFDNLALKQMSVRRYFNDKSWNRYFMGSDGSFTMYFDAVSGAFSKNSISSKIKANGNIIESFMAIKTS